MSHMMLERNLRPAPHPASPVPDRKMETIHEDRLEHAEQTGNCEGETTVALVTEALRTLTLRDFMIDARVVIRDREYVQRHLFC
jgi:hypothetical protein